MSEEQLGELAAVATAVLWTFSTMAWTAAGPYIGALAVSFLRMVIACAMLSAEGGLRLGLWLPLDADGTTWLLLGLSGVMGFFAADLCLFKAYLLIGPRLSLLVVSLSPPMTAIISWVFLGDELAAWQWLGMGVTLAGVAWVVLERTNGEAPHPHLRRGLLLALLAAVAQAVGLVLSKRGLGDYDSTSATFIRALGAMGGYLPLLTFAGRWPAMHSAMRQWRVMLVLAGGALAGPYVGVKLSLEALRHCPTGVVATILATMPVLILPASIFVYHERVSPRALLGALISVVGVAMLVL